MCNAFSCLVTRDRRVLRHPNPHVHSHESMLRYHKLREPTHEGWGNFVRVEVNPATKYVHVDEYSIPAWYADDRDSFETMILDAMAAWLPLQPYPGYYQHDYIDDTTQRLEMRTFTKNLLLCSPNEDTPAVVKWWPTGTVRSVSYAKDGQRHSPSPTKPAYLEWDSDGHCTAVKFYQMGYLVDPDTNTPAMRVWERAPLILEEVLFPYYSAYPQGGTVIQTADPLDYPVPLIPNTWETTNAH